MKKTLNKITMPILTMSYLIIIALFIIFGATVLKGVFSLGNFTRTIYEHPLVVSNASLNAAMIITKMHRSMKDIIFAYSPEETEQELKNVNKYEQDVYKQLDIIRREILGQEGQKLEADTRKLFDDWKPIRDEMVQLLKSGKKEDAIQISKEADASQVEKLEIKMLELTSYARNKADGFINDAEISENKLEKITIYMTISGVFLSFLIAFTATHLALKAEKELRDEKDKLQKALAEINTLRGIIPICSHCKQIRDDEGLWNQLEEYIRAHFDAEFSHGICPDCLKKHYSEYFENEPSIANAE